MSEETVERVSFDEIGDLVMYELNRRLGSPELAQDLPGTLLMKVAMDYVKHLEKRNEIEQAKLDSNAFDPLVMIDQPGLQTVTRIEILSEYLDELEAHWRSASTRMEELLKEVTDDRNVVPDVQEVVPETDGV